MFPGVAPAILSFLLLFPGRILLFANFAGEEFVLVVVLDWNLLWERLSQLSVVRVISVLA